MHKKIKNKKLFHVVDPANTVRFVAREREKAYKPEQEDPEVVQPFAAYSPAGNVKVSLTLKYLSSCMLYYSSSKKHCF